MTAHLQAGPASTRERQFGPKHRARTHPHTLQRFLILLAGLCTSAFSQVPAAGSPRAVELALDFGPPGSPVETGYTGFDSSGLYTPERGLGWIGTRPQNFQTEKPPLNRRRWYHFDPHFFYDEVTTPLRTDGVQSPRSLAFRIDLPAGRYRVVVTLGHLNEARYGMDIWANGTQRARGVQARHWLSSERGRLHAAAGYYKRVRFEVEVAGSGLLLELKGDDSEYRRLLALEQAKSPGEYPVSRFRNDPLPSDYLPFSDIGGPFTQVSLMGLEVFPAEPLPLALEATSLHLELPRGTPGSESLRAAVEAFNARRFQDAENRFRQVGDPLARGLGFLALAGRPDYENELENAREAVESLHMAHQAAGRGVTRELLASARIFRHALDLFESRNVPPNNGLRSTWRAIAELDQTQADDLFYYKSLILQGRWMILLDPHQWAWHAQEGRKRLRIAEKRFPENRFVRFLLHGDPTGWPSWQPPDYVAEIEGAPEWAAGLYAAFNLLVDFSEWWARHKQQPDGSIGGGWGDDVELVGFFGYIGRISEGVSPLSVAAARKLVEGVYERSGQLDPVGGFFYGAADSEHTAEWTGDTLPMMLAVEFGDPLWLERAMQTAKLMREIWMGVNRHGHLHWRSNFLGASGIGPAATHLDSGINWRAAEPAVEVLRLTGNPTIRELVLQHAEALRQDALREDKGKPRGIIPGDIDYETDELGGREVPTWYDPGDIPARRMYGLHQFHSYRLAVLHLAYELTGDARFVEPIRLEAEYARRHGGELRPDRQWELPPGSPEWVALSIRDAVPLWEEIRDSRSPGDSRPLHSTRRIGERILPSIQEIRRNWPYVTTEVQATDRVHIPNGVQMLEVLTGGTPGDWKGAVTYRHAGRQFAAALLDSRPTGFLLAVFLPELEGRSSRPFGIVPWKLPVGGHYEVVWGEDGDGDDRLDAVAGGFEFHLEERGQSIDLDLPTGRSCLVQVSQKLAPEGLFLRPDLAVGPGDVEYHPRWKYLFVTVHNTGAAPAGEYEIRIRQGDIGREFRAVGNGLDAPLDLTPKRTRFGFPWPVPPGRYELKVEVTSRTGQQEITRLNNRLETVVIVP